MFVFRTLGNLAADTIDAEAGLAVLWVGAEVAVWPLVGGALPGAWFATLACGALGNLAADTINTEAGLAFLWRGARRAIWFYFAERHAEALFAANLFVRVTHTIAADAVKDITHLR